MIDRITLLADLQGLLRTIEADLLERSNSKEVPEVGQWLAAEYAKAKKAERTAQTLPQWIKDFITQVAAAWVLSCVFARFLEDNELVDPPKLAGPGERLRRARDEHEVYFRSHPTETDREYLLYVFSELAQLPAGGDVFGEHNPMNALPHWLSGDAAGELLRFFQKIDANSGALVHDFADRDWNTRFLGDLYQDLSEAARKKFALLQTPDFVEEFILDRTLDPALDEFGLTPGREASQSEEAEGQPLTADDYFKMIDPACGSGHFLLGTFPRLLARWQKQEPGVNVRELVQRTLHSIHGVDINPFAIAIARFRLLLAALKACDIHKLANAPAFHMNLACGDSLYHGRQSQQVMDFSDESHYFRTEDAEDLRRILREGTFHTVVANPPYIVPKDKAANSAYRSLYSACHRQYSLAVPFMQRILQLALPSDDKTASAGYTGQITANSFMKREFGKKIIESFLPRVDLTHVVDTSGAYIPGHGTPTVILFGRNRPPVGTTVRAVMGIRGEPSTPADPAQGLVWRAILDQIDQPGSQSDFVSVGDTERERFGSHPWSIGGGGAAELKERLDASSTARLNEVCTVGIGVITGEDNCLVTPYDGTERRQQLQVRPLVLGDGVRDWTLVCDVAALWPYDENISRMKAEDIPHLLDYLWPYRAVLKERKLFSVRVEEKGVPWWAPKEVYADKLRTPLSIVFAEVATHNHFVLDRGGKVFNRTAPVIKLPADATEDDHLALLGLLNSSVACFWMKQVCHQKQMMGGDGIRITSKAKVPFAFNGTALGNLPIPEAWRSGELREHLLGLTRQMNLVSAEYAKICGENILTTGELQAEEIKARWVNALRQRKFVRAQQITLQEEIDFTVYEMFGLLTEPLRTSAADTDDVTISEGERPFCIIDGDNEDGFDVPKNLSEEWPEDFHAIWQKRIEKIRSDKTLRIIECSSYKRRWIGRQGVFNHSRSEDELSGALKSWLLDRLESYFDFDGRMNVEGKPTAKIEISLLSVGKLADIARSDEQFQEVGAVYRDDGAFPVQALVEELVQAENVPLLPILRYKPAGLRKREQWEATWELQRKEDAGEEVGDIPVPPKYTSSDLISTGGAKYWKLRGKLDVPKERWISFPHCASEDGTPMIAWAGYDHLQQATAIAAWYVRIKEELAGNEDPRLIPLLACLIELLPWLKQWHNEVDPEFGMAMGDYYEGFIAEEARSLPQKTKNDEDEETVTTGWTLEQIKAWEPPARTTRRRRRADA